MLKRLSDHTQSKFQHGVAAVEFAIIAMILFVLLFGILEFGRLFYVFNSVQEVTRRAAREAVVRWAVDDDVEENEIKRLALFGESTHLPAGVEITNNNISIDYLNGSGERLDSSSYPDSARDNITECLKETPTNCIAFVRVSITGATYSPMVGLFPFLAIPIPDSTVTMPAESMGLPR